PPLPSPAPLPIISLFRLAKSMIYTLSLHDALPIYLQGRRTIVETHNKLWNGVLKGSVLVGEITKLEFLSPEVVVFHGIGAEIPRSEEHTSELQSRFDLVCRLLLEKKK